MFDDFPYDILFLEICIVLFFSLELEILDIFRDSCFQSPRFLKQKNPERKIIKHLTRNQWGLGKFSHILTSFVNIMNTVFKIFFQKWTGALELSIRRSSASDIDRQDTFFHISPFCGTTDAPCSRFLVISTLNFKTRVDNLACMLCCLWTTKFSALSLVLHLSTYWK